MNRRTLIAHALSAAGIGISGSVLSACDSVRLNRPSSTKPRVGRVAIIGAGIAGLAAASELQAAGLDDIVVLEARERIGGRIWTAKLGDQPVDVGASWIHGVDGNPITKIANENNIRILPTDYDNQSVHFHVDGAAHPSNEHVAEDFWEFLQQQRSQESIEESIRSLFERYVRKATLTDAHRRYLAHVLNTEIEHEFGADIEDLSLSSISGGMDLPGRDALFPGGYDQIIDVLATGLNVLTSRPVTQIDYQEQTVVLTSNDHERYEADAVVVTVPLGVLKHDTIEFVPELPAVKRRSIDSLRMGVLNKTCLLFDEVFWPPDVELIGYIGAYSGRWAESVSLYPYTQEPILMMFNAGAYGVQIEAMSDEKILNEALAALADMYGSLSPLKDAQITRWNSDPWSCGSYSYVPVGSSWAQHSELAIPIEDRLFFAGEATDVDFPATVHGAFLSGIRAARQITANFEALSTFQ